MAQSRGVGFGETAIPATPKGTFYFLGIGINNYVHWPQLYNAVNDLEKVAQLLKDRYGFEEANMKLLKDDQATHANIINELYHFTDPDTLSEDDSLLIYYSGHGHLDRNKNGYWAPVDAQKPEVNIAGLIPNSTIRDQINSMKCRHVLLISDSCFSGSLILRAGAEPDINSLVAGDLVKKKSRRILTSGGHETVSDGNGENSPFAAAIISELSTNSKPLFLADELFLGVRGSTRANAPQMPEFELLYGAGDLGGRFTFVLNGANWNKLVNTPAGKKAADQQRGASVPPTPPTPPRPDFSIQQKELTDLVAKGSADKALKQMMDLALKYDLDISDEVVQLSGRWSSLQRQELQGIISFSDALIERNKINSSLLQLIRRLS